MTTFPIIIRPEYLEICEGDYCAAAILDLFKRWTASKLKKKADVWIYKSQPELRDDLMGLFGLNKIAAALLKLRDWAYIKHRQNPKNRQDKTLQYQLDNVAVIEMLAFLSGVSDIKTDAPEVPNDMSETLELKSQAPDLTHEESGNQSLITSGIEALELSSMPTHHPDDDDLQFFKTFEKRFGKLQAPQIEQLLNYRSLLGMTILREIMKRCEASAGRSWAYVLAAMANDTPANAVRRFEGHETAKYKDDPSPAQAEKGTALPDEADISEMDTDPDAAEDEESTASDNEAQARLGILRGLQIQLGTPTFSAYLSGAEITDVSGDTWTFRVCNEYQVRALADVRLQRAIKQVIAVSVGADEAALTLAFVTGRKAVVA